jgi:hypothetical protein
MLVGCFLVLDIFVFEKVRDEWNFVLRLDQRVLLLLVEGFGGGGWRLDGRGWGEFGEVLEEDGFWDSVLFADDGFGCGETVV